MNRIKQLFNKKPKNILSVYFTAGYPAIDDTTNIITTLSGAGADMIEVGIPFSDPVADGPVIQGSNDSALRNGMTLPYLLEQLEGIRSKTQVPLILMGYLNPVMQYGIEAFLAQASKCGIDGIIIPDLPIAEYKAHYQSLFNSHNLEMIFLITPQTSAERVWEIDTLSDSFIYLVTASATTGSSISINAQQEAYFNSIKNLSLCNPLLAGFGIHNKEGFEQVCNHTNGAIIGSSFIKAIANRSSDLQNTIYNFVKTIQP